MTDTIFPTLQTQYIFDFSSASCYGTLAFSSLKMSLLYSKCYNDKDQLNLLLINCNDWVEGERLKSTIPKDLIGHFLYRLKLNDLITTKKFTI
jgi:hypothetical protein